MNTTFVKFIKDYSEQLPEDAVAETQRLIDQVNSVKEDGDVEAIKGATEELSQYMQQLGGQMYQDAADAAPAGDEQASYDDDEDVVDAEFTES